MYGGHTVTIVVLAGGKGARMGGAKAFRELRGMPLIEWVLGAVEPQSADIVISANEDIAAFEALGFPVVQDSIPGYAGPLAGLHAAMRQTQNAWVASVPCDVPFLPDDTVLRLREAAGEADAAVAVANGRREPAVAIYRIGVLSRLEAYLAAGNRKVEDWLMLLQAREAVFEDAEDFINFNSLEQLEAANLGETS